MIATTALLSAFGESTKAARQKRIDQTVATMLAGIPQHGNTLGDPKAPYTLQVFADLECHDSRNWFTNYLPPIIAALVRPGTLKIEYHAFKTDTIWPKIFIDQQTAALAAGAQNEMWNYIETFYHEQGREYTPYATNKYLHNLAVQIPGLDLTQWRHDRRTGRRSETIAEDDHTARMIGFHDTPSFLLGFTGGKLKPFTGKLVIKYPHQKHPVSLITTEDLQKAIDRLTPA